jgi:hypothetical protein
MLPNDMKQKRSPGVSSKAARESMPLVTAWIDALRLAFGREGIDQAVKNGLKDGTFWAMENGMVIGSPPENERSRIEGEWCNHVAIKITLKTSFE